jgi:cobalamin biosynthesis protein CbiD
MSGADVSTCAAAAAAAASTMNESVQLNLRLILPPQELEFPYRDGIEMTHTARRYFLCRCHLPHAVNRNFH